MAHHAINGLSELELDFTTLRQVKKLIFRGNSGAKITNVLDLYTIATKPEFLGRDLKLTATQPYKPVFQARPGLMLPVVCHEHGRAISSHTGIWEGGANADSDAFIPIESVLSKKPYNRWIRARRCVVPANCFFARRSGRIYCIRILGQRLFGIGAVLTAKPGSRQRSFRLLSCASADVIGTLTERLPVIVRLDHVEEWLTTSQVARAMQFADDAASQWYDFFEVSTDVMTAGVNDARLLKPVGLSNAQLQEREERLRAGEYQQDRIIRRNTKGR